MQACGAKTTYGGREYACTLSPHEPGVNHANRVGRLRPERDGHPTTVYETVLVWKDGSPARTPHGGEEQGR